MLTFPVPFPLILSSVSSRFSTHSDSSSLVLYPMKYPSRQRERRGSMMHFLKGQYSNV